ncbi:hypothetical protein AKJ37_06085 [candidate division MSBL1 archaeon SCGC-AAA259I09]|uniref:Ribbon-helix-helix protein CopG domain-containing protein n=2 Tax=candidate division MSBL1 TaxID=215777 RepID=A0A133UPJ5_9EURY|nr:hypothetical protein AKJ37_06085 [candidate division MSBL1 archaeon SCGC-AAA259I09]KXA97144.1 hypothetical protein AKJ39_03650 [candidate division MSBL1 archaeon SCGC-AAA259J03]
MPEETITVRIDSEWKKRIEKLAAEQRETKSDVVRKALIDYIQRKEERKEIERSAAKKFASGKISFEELTRITGYEKARKIAFYVKTAERSFEEGLS